MRNGSSDSSVSGPPMASTTPGFKSPMMDSSPGGGSRGSKNDALSSSYGARSGKFGGSTEYELIPIDHGLCLSDELVIDWCDWCWLDWRQMKEVNT